MRELEGFAPVKGGGQHFFALGNIDQVLALCNTKEFMRKSDKSFTVRLSEELLEAANEAAAQDHRKLTTYLRALIVKDCQSRHIEIKQASPPKGIVRFDPVSHPTFLREEIDGPDEPV